MRAKHVTLKKNTKKNQDFGKHESCATEMALIAYDCVLFQHCQHCQHWGCHAGFALRQTLLEKLLFGHLAAPYQHHISIMAAPEMTRNCHRIWSKLVKCRLKTWSAPLPLGIPKDLLVVPAAVVVDWTFCHSAVAIWATQR